VNKFHGESYVNIKKNMMLFFIFLIINFSLSLKKKKKKPGERARKEAITKKIYSKGKTISLYG
jgi:hypothetical protein